MQSPQLQLYNKTFDLAKGYDIPVISQKEMTEDISYPFVVLSRSDGRMNIGSFDTIDGQTSVTIDIWSPESDLGLHDSIVYGLQVDLSQLETLPNYQVRLNDITVNQISEDTTNQSLAHSQIVAEFDTY